MSKIRVGAIGAGYWGPNLIRNFAELPESELVAVSDLKQERLDKLTAHYPRLITTNNYRDFFTMGLDAVVIATPPATHFSLARECLENGLHVLVEKPITLNSQDATDLIDLAERKNLRLMVGNTFEYNPAVQVIKQLVQSGELGHIHYIDAVRTNLGLFQPNLNVMWDLAPHDISILLYILGIEPTGVSAMGGASVFSHIHDIVYMHMQFPDGLLAHIHVSWLNPQKVRKITVVGSEKMLVYDDVDPLEKIRIYDKGVTAPPYTSNFGEFQCSYRYGDVIVPHIQFTEPLRVEVKEFVDAIVQGRLPRSSGEVGRNIVRILEAAESSLQNGGGVQTLQPIVSRDTITA
ncbi:MAG: Gfo/Idh/MocA family oxidoreductase [Blastochloris sp.]|nr:Gfo/Idh/MocA family oxidoreductase [Blastochloris sp.]